MKRKLLLFSFIVIASSQISKAQISKGSIFLGGSFGVSTQTSDNDLNDWDVKNNNYNFSPALGKVIKDNWVFGVELNVGGYHNKNGLTSYNKLFTTGAGVFWRRYFEVLNKFYLFGHARAGVSYTTEDIQSGSQHTDVKGYGIAASIAPGLSYAIKKKIHLEMSLNSLANISYAHKKAEFSSPIDFSTSKINEFNVGSNLFSQSGYSVGIRFFL